MFARVRHGRRGSAPPWPHTCDCPHGGGRCLPECRGNFARCRRSVWLDPVWHARRLLHWSRHEPGRAVGRAARCPLAQRGFLPRERSRRMGCRGARIEHGRAAADVGRRARHGVSRGRAWQLLGRHSPRPRNAPCSGRRGGVRARRCARRVQRTGSARRRPRPAHVPRRRDGPAAAASPRLRRQHASVGSARAVRCRDRHRVRVPRLRPAAVQSADRGIAAPASPAGRRRRWMDRAIPSSGRWRMRGAPPGCRSDARAIERNAVRRCGPALCGRRCRAGARDGSRACAIASSAVH